MTETKTGNLKNNPPHEANFQSIGREKVPQSSKRIHDAWDTGDARSDAPI